MPGAGPERLTRADAAVVAAFVVALVLALVLLPLGGVVHALAAVGVGVVGAVLTGLIVYRGMRPGA